MAYPREDEETRAATPAIPAPGPSQAGQRMPVTKPLPGRSPAGALATSGSRVVGTATPTLTNVGSPGAEVSKVRAGGQQSVNGQVVDDNYLSGLSSRKRTGTMADGSTYTYYEDQGAIPAAPGAQGGQGYKPWFQEQGTGGAVPGGPNLAVGQVHGLRESFARIKSQYPGISDGQAAAMAEDEQAKYRGKNGVDNWNKQSEIRQRNAEVAQDQIRSSLETEILSWAKEEDPRLAAMIMVGMRGNKSAIPGATNYRPNWDVIKKPVMDDEGYPIEGAYDYYRYNQTDPEFNVLPVFPQKGGGQAAAIPTQQVSPTVAQSTPKGSGRVPPEAAKAYLLANPQYREQFIEMYGEQNLPAGV